MQKNEPITNTEGIFKKCVRKCLTSRFLPPGLALLAIILCLGSLGADWFMDDHIHRHIILDTGRFGAFSDSRLDIFRFCDGDPERNKRLMDIGILPWWTYPKVKAAFWRPLTALTHWLDYQLWPQSPLLMHAHSVLWYGILAGAVALLYRRFMVLTMAAGLAGLMWAVEDAHGMPVGFLANRNILISTFFGVLALIAHDRWRKNRWAWGILLGPLFLMLSLLSKEMGVAAFAYIFSYSIFIDRGTRLRRLITLLPYVLIIIVWRIVWSQLGYGVDGLGMYIDPLRQPYVFIVGMIKKAPILLLAQLALPPADVTIFTDVNRAWLWGFALIFLTIFTILIWPLLRRDRMARFWTLAMVLCIIPACATTASDRLLFFVGIGAMGLLSQMIIFIFNNASLSLKQRWQRVSYKLFAIALVLIHLLLAPLVLVIRSTMPFGPKEKWDRFIVNTEMDDSVTQQDLIVVNPPHPMGILYLPPIQELRGRPVPRRVRVLASGYPAVALYRKDTQTLTVRPEAGFMPLILDKLFRGDDYPLQPGEQVKLTGLTVQVTKLTDDHRPAEAVFHFDVPLEDPSLRWLYFDEGDFLPFIPPAVAETVELQISREYKVR